MVCKIIRKTKNTNSFVFISRIKVQRHGCLHLGLRQSLKSTSYLSDLCSFIRPLPAKQSCNKNSVPHHCQLFNRSNIPAPRIHCRKLNHAHKNSVPPWSVQSFEQTRSWRFHCRYPIMRKQHNGPEQNYRYLIVSSLLSHDRAYM